MMKYYFAALLLALPLTAQVHDWGVMEGAPMQSIPADQARVDTASVVGNVLSSSRPSFSFVIPAVASIQGANGAYFRSNVTLVNHKTTNQVVGIEWLPRGEAGSGVLLGDVTVPPRTFYSYKDIVGTLLRREGMAALRFISLNPDRTVDPTGLIDGFSRIWTEMPGREGTVSQSFDPVVDTDLVGPDQAVILGLRQDDSYRTNIGIVNLDTVQYHTWTVRVSGQQRTEFTVTVAPNSMEQVPLPAGTFGDIAVTITGDGNAIRNWTAYGSTVDNRTGDGWVSRAAQPLGQQLR